MEKVLNNIWISIRPYVRVAYRMYKNVLGFTYDFKRLTLYSGWREDMKDPEQRNYYSVMIYHALEKSLSYKDRNKNSGWTNAYKILGLLKLAQKYGNIGYHDKASKQVLEHFIDLPENINDNRSEQIRNDLNSINFNSEDQHGIQEYSFQDYKRGVLDDPESFFLSRYSLREFKDEIIDEQAIMRAINLTMKTPSVCNRQGWHIYHTSNNDVKKTVLKFQNGNKPFGEHIPNLFVITADLKAFFASEEHYQHWIDGGLLSMSLMYALHSIGIASCPLNWSQSPKSDKKLREIVNIKPTHTIIMLLAAGYPDEQNKICVSARRPIDEVYSKLEIKN